MTSTFDTQSRADEKRHAHGPLQSCGTDDHVVHFYENDGTLPDVVADFLASGLVAGDPAVIVTTEAHRASILDRLSARGVDVAAACRADRLQIYEAGETLAKLMVGSLPSRERFLASFGRTIESLAARYPGRRIRAYGEMVDLLWRANRSQAAIQLEEMWNDLQRTHAFSLLCAYVMDHCHEAADLHRVCAVHSQVFGFDRARTAFEPAQTPASEKHLQNARTLVAEIAQRKAAEAALRDSHEQLRASTARLESLHADLQHSVRFNQMFTTVLGEDLRNPLAAIMTGTRMALNRSNSQEVIRPLARIAGSGERMVRMIDQLLDFNRVRVGIGIPVEPSRSDLGPALGQVMDELDDANPDCVISLEHAGGETEGDWDVDRLSQVFSNLIANAVQHGDRDHGVRVRVDGTQPDLVRVEVLNRGVIPEALIPKLFEPLTGGDRRRECAQGLGLGLFISQEIIKAHGGRIQVRSSEAEGTVFAVLLPRTPRGASVRSGVDSTARAFETTRA